MLDWPQYKLWLVRDVGALRLTARQWRKVLCSDLSGPVFMFQCYDYFPFEAPISKTSESIRSSFQWETSIYNGLQFASFKKRYDILQILVCFVIQLSGSGLSDPQFVL